MDTFGKAILTKQHYLGVRILSTVTTPQWGEHVLFVHAHPDDETIATGGTIATLIDAGASVTLITCTRGERGEVVPAELQHLSGDALGEYRETELVSAMKALGVTDFRILGTDGARAEGSQPHKYRDSGMQWGPSGAEPLSEPPLVQEPSANATLSTAELGDIVADIVAVIAEVQPTAIVSYDERGGYGHPDHIRTHEAATMAALMTNVPYFSIVASGAEEQGDIRVDVSGVLERKVAALNAYRTQLTVAGDTIVHSGGQVEPIGRIELFRQNGVERDVGVEWSNLGILGRVASCLIAVLLGGIIGVIGTANYQAVWALVPLGISALFLSGLRLLFATRVVAGFAAAGLIAAVWMLAQTGPGGSVLIPANTPGYTWAYGVMVISLLVLAWPSRWTFSRATMVKVSETGKDVDSP
jgi:N-acetyl-1-D-myo-inositol-2-amino-2-deoxy-alpha-D-glucopyranoside deacetylase